jgi:hypothetical protein
MYVAPASRIVVILRPVRQNIQNPDGDGLPGKTPARSGSKTACPIFFQPVLLPQWPSGKILNPSCCLNGLKSFFSDCLAA